jgi:hypothetical protein
MQTEICDGLVDDKITLTGKMLHHVLEGYRYNGEVERAIFLFREVCERGVLPRHRAFTFMIALCVEMKEPEEALRILKSLDNFNEQHQVTENLWWTVLDSCARNGHVPPTQRRG